MMRLFRAVRFFGVIARPKGPKQSQRLLRRQLRCLLAMTLVLVFASTSLVYAASKGNPPVAHWRFDEGGGPTAYDEIGTNDGTLSAGDATGSNDTVGEMWTVGKIGNALECDGTNDEVTITNINYLSTDPWTVTAWLYQTGTKNYEFVIGEKASSRAFNMDEISGRVQYRDKLGAYHTWDIGFDYTNAWHHFAWVAPGNTTIELYVDGKSYSTVAVDSEIYINNIGNAYGGAQWAFTGKIDDVRIYDYDRTPAQILVDYNAGSAAHLAAGTDPNEGNAPTVYLKFDENTGTNAYDRSGNNNNGTISGTSWTAGKYGSALSLDGSNDWVSVADSSTIDMTSAITMSAWVKLNSYTSGGANTDRGAITIKASSYYMSITSSTGKLASYLYGVDATHRDSNSQVPLNRWAHVAITYDGSNIKWYIDGQLDKTFAATGTITTTATVLGIGMENGSYGRALNGLVDEVKVYNYARTQAQIAYDYDKGKPVAHYKFDEGTGSIAHNEYSTAGSGAAAPVGWWRMDEGTGGTTADSSGNGNTATLYPQGTGTNTTTAMMWDQTGKIGPDGLEFDGTDDYVSVVSNTALNLSGGGTVSAWVKIPSTWTGTLYPSMVSKGANAGWDTDGWGLFAFSSNSTGVGMRNGGTTFSRAFTNTIKDEWFHLVGTWDGTTVKVYQNGVLKTSIAQTINPPTTSTSLAIGRDSGVQYFGGQVDDVRIYTYARTAEQIYNDYKNTHGTIVGGAKFVDGKINKCLEFDGVDDEIFIDDIDLAEDTPWTIMYWYNSDTTAENMTIGMTDTNYNRFYHRASGTYIRMHVNSGAIADFNFPSGITATGAWHHVAVVCDGTDSNNFKFYFDGNYVETETVGASRFIVDNIGNPYTGTTYVWDGKLDDVRIYNYARTAAQILEDYTTGAARLGAQSAGEADPWGGVLPIAHWKLDENTGVVARDASENANDGTLGGDGAGTDVPTWTQGKVGPGLSFDATDDYVIVADNNDLDIGTSDFTLAAWIKTGDDITNTRRIISKGSAGSIGYGLAVKSSKIRIAIQASGGTNQNEDFGTVAQNTWYHVVAVFDRDINMELFLNGVSQGTQAYDSGNDGLLDNSAGFNIGRHSGGSQYYDGRIDDVRIYAYALTQAQVAWLYNRGKPVGYWRFDEAVTGSAAGTGNIKDDSVHDNDGDGTGTNIAWTTGKFGGALSFNGTDDYVAISDSSDGALDPNYITVSAWVKPTTINHKSNIVNKQGSGTDRAYIIYTESDNYPRFVISTNGNNIVSADGVTPLSVGSWFHLLGTYDGSNVKIYVNGVLEDTTPTSGTIYNSADRIEIGLIPDAWASAYKFNGLIDDVRIYNYARTADQVLQDFNAGAASRLGD